MAAAVAAGAGFFDNGTWTGGGRGFVKLNCTAGGELLDWNDAALWFLLLLYLFVGVYVVCDYYFVPALEVIGERLKWSGSIQGAFLMAVGASFPDFLTALFGVLFFSDENPGPATNIGSAVFNICCVVSISILCLPAAGAGRPAGFHVNKVAFARDCGFMVAAAVESYVFCELLSPGELYWPETLAMTVTYAVYIGAVFCSDTYVQFGCAGGKTSGSRRQQHLQLATSNNNGDDTSDGEDEDEEEEEEEKEEEEEDDDDDAGDDCSRGGGGGGGGVTSSRSSSRTRTVSNTVVDSIIIINSPRSHSVVAVSRGGGGFAGARGGAAADEYDGSTASPMPVANDADLRAAATAHSAAAAAAAAAAAVRTGGLLARLKQCLVETFHVIEWPYRRLFELTIPSVFLPPQSPRLSAPGLPRKKTTGNVVAITRDEASVAAEEERGKGEEGEEEATQGPPRSIGFTVATFLLSTAVSQ